MSAAGTRGRNKPRDELAQREIDTEAVRLYNQGRTVREVAEMQGCSPSGAWQRIQRALAAVPVADVTTMRQSQLESFALQKRVVLAILANPPPKVDHGKVIYQPLAEGEVGPPRPMVDRDVQMRASAELRKIEDSISRLTGTRMPVVHEVHEITEDAIDAELRRLTVELGRNEPSREAAADEGAAPARG